MKSEAVIGLEIHIQLNTATKLFCGDAASFSETPNVHVCPVCLGLPGALPVLNARAVSLALRTALALECAVSPRSVFVRKRYAYPDLPKGYQITQHMDPLATNGTMRLEHDGGTRNVRITRVHLEEDAARLIHDRLAGRTAIDCNRAGVALVEIVTAPDLRTPAEARTFLVQLRRLLRWLDVSDCEMETGSLRVDANVSVRDTGDPSGDPGVAPVYTELKNMNSFAHVEHALAWELARQRQLIADGHQLDAHTISWDAERGAGTVLRAKEDTASYGYFGEPDIPPLELDVRAIGEARDALPELPRARARRLAEAFGISPETADVLTAERGLADYFEALAAASPDAVVAANWVTTDVLAWLNRNGSADIESFPLAPAALGSLLQLEHDGVVSHTAARRTVLPLMLEQDLDAATAVARSGVKLVNDPARIRAWIDEVMRAHPDEVARYRGGTEKIIGFLMGQVMARSNGAVDPQRAMQLLRERLGGERR